MRVREPFGHAGRLVAAPHEPMHPDSGQRDALLMSEAVETVEADEQRLLIEQRDPARERVDFEPGLERLLHGQRDRDLEMGGLSGRRRRWIAAVASGQSVALITKRRAQAARDLALPTFPVWSFTLRAGYASWPASGGQASQRPVAELSVSVRTRLHGCPHSSARLRIHGLASVSAHSETVGDGVPTPVRPWMQGSTSVRANGHVLMLDAAGDDRVRIFCVTRRGREFSGIQDRRSTYGVGVVCGMLASWLAMLRI